MSCGSGVFEFRIWRLGAWQTVLVDDLVPTLGGEPVFSHSRGGAEWWPALRERAYAK